MDRMNDDENALKLQYNATSCYHIESFRIYANIQQLNMRYSPHSIEKGVLQNYIDDDDIYYIFIIIDNNYIYIKNLVNDDYACRLLDGNYIFTYNYETQIKNVFIDIIRKHNFVCIKNQLFEMIKNNIHALKTYFANIMDIYKYILPIITNVYLNDDDIYLELFSMQDIKVKCMTHQEQYEINGAFEDSMNNYVTF